MSRSLLRDLPLLELVALEATIRLGSLALAAEALSVTPSAISHRIRQIERTLGLTLLERRGRGVVPTAAGLACHAELSPLIAGFREATLALRMHTQQRLHFDVTPVLGASWLPRQFPALRQHLGLPGLRFELSTNRVPDARPNPAADIVMDFSAAPPADSARRLFDGGMGIYVAAASPLAAPVSVHDLQHHALVRHSAADWIQWSGAVFGHCPPLNYSVTLDDPLSALEACIAGAGPVLLTTLAARDHVQAGLLRSAHPASVDTGCYWLALTPRGLLKPLAHRAADHLLTLAASGWISPSTGTPLNDTGNPAPASRS